MKNKLLLLTLSLCLSSIVSYGQDNLSDYNKFQVGLSLGSSNILGDVRSTFGSGLTVSPRFSFNRFFALRTTLSAHSLTGLDYWTSQTSSVRNKSIADLGYAYVVNNYSTTLYDISIEPLLTLNASNLEFYLGGGPNFHRYDVRYDALDANNSPYDFSSVEMSIDQRNNISKDDLEIIKNIIDGEYETDMDTDSFWERDRSFGISFCLGTNYQLNEQLSVGLDSRFIFSFEDNLDGYRFVHVSRRIFHLDKLLSVGISANYALVN